MKKIISLILVVMMLATMSMTAFAAGERTGTITINNYSRENIYSIFKMLDLSLSNDGTAYTYTVAEGWRNFFAKAETQQYITFNDAGAAEWKTLEDEDTKATFAKLAMKYASDEGLTPIQTSLDNESFNGIFSNLELGYYLIDSTMGALCGLTTTAPNATINAKNAPPTIEKQVKEDSTNQWTTANTADIGQPVEYRVTIKVHAGAQNFILHDTMEAGLDFQSVTQIEHVRPGTDTHPTDSSLYDVYEHGDAEMTDDTCDFEVHFTQDFCDLMEDNDSIVVYYTAILNRNAEIYDGTNDNTAWLTFGDNGTNTHAHKSNESTVTTKTFAIDIVKTDTVGNLLDGAKFKIYDAETGGKEVSVVLSDDGTGYVRNASLNTGVEIEVKDGKVRVSGLDNGTYYLEETQEPEGYNILTARQKFIISDANLYAEMAGETLYGSGGIRVTNKAGTALPETGAAGTMMFITFGMFTVLATGVLLVTKKRMSMIEE